VTNSHRIPSKYHKQFLKMLPRIRLHARIAFRGLDPEARQEAVQDVECNAWKAFVALVERGKADLAYAMPLATYGVRQHREKLLVVLGRNTLGVGHRGGS
jgi:hypothetical protein